MCFYIFSFFGFVSVSVVIQWLGVENFFDGVYSGINYFDGFMIMINLDLGEIYNFSIFVVLI